MKHLSDVQNILVVFQSCVRWTCWLGDIAIAANRFMQLRPGFCQRTSCLHPSGNPNLMPSSSVWDNPLQRWCLPFSKRSFLGGIGGLMGILLLLCLMTVALHLYLYKSYALRSWSKTPWSWWKSFCWIWWALLQLCKYRKFNEVRSQNLQKCAGEMQKGWN